MNYKYLNRKHLRLGDRRPLFIAWHCITKISCEFSYNGLDCKNNCVEIYEYKRVSARKKRDENARCDLDSLKIN